MYGDMKNIGRNKAIVKPKTNKVQKQNSSTASSLNTSKISVSRNKYKAGMDYFLNSDFKQSYQSATKKVNKKKIKPKRIHNQYAKVRETGLKHFGEKGNRSASPHALAISKAIIKGSRNHHIRTQFKDKSTIQSENQTFNANMISQKNKFDYLNTKTLNKSHLSRTTNKPDLNHTNELKKCSESPNFGKDNIAALRQMGIYHNKTFYKVNQPKRAGTTLTNYQEESKRKRKMKKFVNKVNLANPSSSTTTAIYHTQSNEDNFHKKMSKKGDDKIF